MAKNQSHVSFSLLIGIAYFLFGYSVLGVDIELASLALLLVVATSLLPNVDQPGGDPAKELSGIIAAVMPIILIDRFPAIEAGGMVRMTLVVIVSYMLTKIVIVRILQATTVHRGSLHTIPAAIITGELVYLLFQELYWKYTVYIAMAGFLGFMSHLLLDGYGNLDIIAGAMGEKKKQPKAMTFVSDTFGRTAMLYVCVAVLGWYVARDIYPDMPYYRANISIDRY